MFFPTYINEKISKEIVIYECKRILSEFYFAPYHAGDLPPLFGNQGYAFSAFVTDRFAVREIVEKTIIIHSKPDDFKTQPSGDSGEKMACGKIFYGR